MNITTSTLLNLLSPKLSENIKSKLDNMSKSVEQKPQDSQNKSVKTILKDIFVSLLENSSSSSKAEKLLQNTRHIFDIKMIQQDISTIIESIKNEPKLIKEVIVLKEFLVNIKDLDENKLKSNILNSGITLESKLKDISNILKDTPTTKLYDLHKQLSNLNIVLKQNISTDENDLKNISKNMEQLDNKLQQIIEKLPLKDIVKEEVVLFKDQLKQFIQNLTLLSDKNIKQAFQNSIEKLNRDILKEISQSDKRIENLNVLKENVKQISVSLDDINENKFNLLNISNMKHSIEFLDKAQQDTTLENRVKSAVFKLLNSVKDLNVDNSLELKNKDISNIKTNIGSLNKLIDNAITSLKAQDQNLNISDDIKRIFLNIDKKLDTELLDSKTSDEVKQLKQNVDKVLTQIEYFQALSYATDSNFTYLPFVWDELDDGDIKFETKDDGYITCQINLKLKHYDEIRIFLKLDQNKNIELNFGVFNSELLATIQQNLQTLRSATNNIGLNLTALNVFSLNNLNQFNPYESSDNFDFGVNIKV